jgi:hypothetical protein
VTVIWCIRFLLAYRSARLTRLHGLPSASPPSPRRQRRLQRSEEAAYTGGTSATLSTAACKPTLAAPVQFPLDHQLHMVTKKSLRNDIDTVCMAVDASHGGVAAGADRAGPNSSGSSPASASSFGRRRWSRPRSCCVANIYVA